LSFTSPWLGYHDLAYSGESGALLARHSVLARHQRIAWISPFHGAEWSRNRLAGLRANLPRGTEVHEALGPWVSEWDMLPLGDQGRAPAGRSRIFKRFERVLQQALDSRSSLWVAASDAVALHCLEWLASRGITVPGHLALAGFDDTREALRHGLTSVRFDVEAMARAMVRQVLMPGASRQRLTRYEGMVIVRASTP
jgi:DNA-binding LacI/PurR family transcriptional regulator